jgi:uncharacterized protein (TIGR01777 family)
MRILVTGGSGFIGQSLCRRLLADGNAVDVVSRQPAKVAGLFGAHTTLHSYPITPRLIEQADAVVNLAGAPIFGPLWTAARKKILWDSRIGVTEQLVDALATAQRKPKILISGSAIGYYGPHGNDALAESSEPSPDFGHALCAAWEQAALRAETVGLRVCTLRTGLVLGPRGGLLQRMSIPFRLGLGGRLGKGEQWMSWIHLNDHVNAIVHLLGSSTLHGPFNLTAPNPVTNRAFTDCLAAAVHRPAFLHLPAWLLRGLLGEMADLLLGSQRVFPRRLTDEAGFQFAFAELDHALADCLGAR